MDGRDKITSSAKIVENEKSEKQHEDLKRAEADAAARKKAAMDARKANEKAEKEKKAEEKAQKAKQKSGKSSKSKDGLLSGVVDEKTAMAGAALLGTLVQKSMKNNTKKTLMILGFVVVLAAVIGVFVGPSLKAMLDARNEPPPVTVINELTDAEKAEILKNKAIEIKNVVLGEARQRKELLVLERDVQVESVWESTWGGLEVFKKAKKIISFGTGYYNIDLSGLAESGINVDHTKKVVEITVPHAFLKSVSIDEGKTQYEDTQKGLLSFGELKLTMEQQSLLKSSVEDSMRTELETPEVLAEADKAGKLSVGEIYQPLVSAVSDEYYVEVKIA